MYFVIINTILILLICLLQYHLFYGDNGIDYQNKLKQQIQIQHIKNERLKARNTAVINNIFELKNGSEGIEERARQELNMIKEGEVLYMIVKGAKNK